MGMMGEVEGRETSAVVKRSGPDCPLGSRSSAWVTGDKASELAQVLHE